MGKPGSSNRRKRAAGSIDDTAICLKAGAPGRARREMGKELGKNKGLATYRAVAASLAVTAEDPWVLQSTGAAHTGLNWFPPELGSRDLAGAGRNWAGRQTSRENFQF